MASDADGPPASFSTQIDALKLAFDSTSSKSLILFGGKGGVGKTTISALAALHLAHQRPVVLFTSDPASNLGDLLGGETVSNLTIEQLDARKLYENYLKTNLESFLELGDRGTYLDKEEMRRLLELSLPGIDELMAWMHIGDLAKNLPEHCLIVDTAPTGHTLRMLSAGHHFEQFGAALEAMQAKHRELVEQLTRRRVRDAIDEFVARFRKDCAERLALFRDPVRTGFIPVYLSEPWVIEQTKRLCSELRQHGIDVPYVVLNRAAHDCDCARCSETFVADRHALNGFQPMAATVAVPEACTPLDSLPSLRDFLLAVDHRGARQETSFPESSPLTISSEARMVFFAGKGGVGKTTSASSVALQYAAANPDQRFILISVDPAHSVRDVFAHEPPPSNLKVETIDTRDEWQRLRSSIGEEIEKAISGITPKGLSIRHDSDVMQRLVEIAPPGADELFALMRLNEIMEDEECNLAIVDTAPTGHFLRLLDLPSTATEWVREFMRILLHYKELIPSSSLGEQLVRASRALHRLENELRSKRSEVVVVLRPERIIALETSRLAKELRDRKIAIAGYIANYVTPKSDCSCDESRRAHEADAVSSFKPLTLVERQAGPVTALADLQKLIPISQTGR